MCDELKAVLPKVQPMSLEAASNELIRKDHAKDVFNALMALPGIKANMADFTPAETLETMQAAFEAIENMSYGQMAIVEALIELL